MLLVFSTRIAAPLRVLRFLGALTISILDLLLLDGVLGSLLRIGFFFFGSCFDGGSALVLIRPNHFIITTGN